ncbi:MAG: Ig-like domain-containing protein [candidate division Zixibacteria bacterium]|nr:Ig-like domain-containing protein [candidate division Zixibacteria bacterium]
MKGRIITAIAALIALGLFWGCEEEQTRPLSSAPEEPVYFIDSVSPADSSTGVPINTSVMITFLRPMDTSSYSRDRFYINSNRSHAMYRTDSTVRFQPFNGWDENTLHQVEVRAGLKDKLGNLLTQDYKFSFTTAFNNPMFQSTYPVNNAEGIRPDAHISVTFTNEMNASTINNSTFLVSNSTTGTVSYSNRTAVFTPDDSLDFGQTYTVTLKGSIEDAIGDTLGADFEFSFSILGNDAVAPHLISTSPVDNAVDVSLGSSISITFSEELKKSGLSSDAFTISGNSQQVDGGILIVDSTVHFFPLYPLLLNTEYNVTFLGRISDTAGNEVSIFKNWSFTTVSGLSLTSTNPPNGSEDIPLDMVISATFSELLNGATITSNSIIVYDQYFDTVQGSITNNNMTLSFQPDSLLKHSRTYKAILSTGIGGIYGESYGGHNWAFRTIMAAQIVQSYPSDGDRNVPTDTTFSATFSNKLNPATVNSNSVLLTEINTGRRINGAIQYSNRKVYFTPDSTLIRGYFYRLELTEDIRNIYNLPLESGATRTFAVDPGVLMPLSIGNKWIYDLDTIIIVSDTLINNEIWSVDQKARLYINRPDELALENDHTLFPFEIGQKYPDSTYAYTSIVVPYGTLQVINREYLYGGTGAQYYFYFSPGIGIVKIKICTYQGSGQYQCNDRRNLVDYEFVE